MEIWVGFAPVNVLPIDVKRELKIDVIALYFVQDTVVFIHAILYNYFVIYLSHQYQLSQKSKISYPVVILK